MSEVLPPARATLMAAHMAFISLGRAAGDVLAPGLFGLSGITANALAAVGFNLLAVVLLRWVVVAKSSDQ